MAAFRFPLVYQTLIDGFSGTKKYIDGVNGSNSNNGDAVNTAYATIDYAITANTSATATMFVIAEGTYTMTAVSTGNSLAIRDGGNHREFVCQPGSVIIQWTATTADRDSPIIQFTNTNSKVYGGILRRNNNGRTTNYTVAYYKAQSLGNFYNCVFSETNANNAWSYQYDNYASNNIALRNCTFYNLMAPSGNYTNAGTCLTIDSVFNTTVTTGGTETNVLKSQTVNATTYETTGVTTAGVYSGTYAWGQAVTGVSFQINGSVVISANEGQTVTVVIVGSTETGTRNYTISGVSSADINGASLTGTVNLVNNQATFNLTLTEDISSGEGIENLTVIMEDPEGNQQATLTVYDTSAVLYVTPTAVPGDTITVRLNTNSATPPGETFVFQNVGFAYSVTGYTGNFPALTLYKGRTYTFDFQAVTSSHPIALRLAGGNNNSAVLGTTGNDPSNGVYGSGAIVTYAVPLDAPASIRYQCVYHSGMIGTVNLVDDPNSGVANGTEIAYIISGDFITSSNIGQPLTGNFTVNNNSAEFTIIIPTIVSTTLTVTAYGETASCAITFNPSITVEVIDMDTYVDLEVATRAFSMLPLSAISIADSSANADPQLGFALIGTADFEGFAVPVTVTETTAAGSQLDVYVILPFDMFIPKSLSTAADPQLGFALIGTADFEGFAVPVTVTETTETGGLLDLFIVRPLGQELIREYWI